MYYEIEVNLARKGATPVWRALRDNAENVCVWYIEEEARAALDEESRGEDARIVRKRTSAWTNMAPRASNSRRWNASIQTFRRPGRAAIIMSSQTELGSAFSNDQTSA